jgi:hypothetical protein
LASEKTLLKELGLTDFKPSEEPVSNGAWSVPKFILLVKAWGKYRNKEYKDVFQITHEINLEELSINIIQSTPAISDSVFLRKINTEIETVLKQTIIREVQSKISAGCNIPSEIQQDFLALLQSTNGFVSKTEEREERLIQQIPTDDFLDGHGVDDAFLTKKCYLWFTNFVYLMRNALFHEIIDPLDPDWQVVFKNAYLVLREIVETNTDHINSMA